MAPKPQIPFYIDSRDVARRIKWPARRVQRIWRSLGIALKRGKSVVTTRKLLREELPEQWEVILEWLSDL